MKKLVILFILCLFIFNCSKEEQETEEESTIDEPIVEESTYMILSSQTDIDNFNLTAVEEVLYIRELEEGNITNLEGLASLKSAGAIVIEQTSLTSLKGLDNLEIITGTIENNGDNGSPYRDGLYIFLNEKLLSLEGLDKLSTVGNTNFYASVQILMNNSLTSLSSLDNLLHIEQNLQIRSNSNLLTLNGLNKLNSVEYLEIRGNESLASFNSFLNLKEVKLWLDIRENKSLTSLEGLNNLTSVGLDLEIAGNTSLTSLKGLEGITQIGGILNIGRVTGDFINYTDLGNDNLVNLCDISQLITSGQITANEYFVLNNKYNPNFEEIQNTGSGGCEE